MAKYQSKAKVQKAYNKNPARESIIPANCVAVFPMLIVSGSTYITEHGTMPQNLTYDKGSFLFWQEVFDGRSSIKIQWEDAIILEKPEGKNYYLAETKVGKYFYGKPISNSAESLEIGEDQSFDEFITMKANQTVKLRFEFQKSNRLMFESLKEDLRFVDNDLYKLYLIPELCEGKLMYISDYEEIYEDKSGLSYACEITFQSLGSELQKSGKAVEQYPQWSAPGEFYVKPKIVYSVGNVREKRIIIDPMGSHPKPIKYLQVELQGPALTSCVYALGRRQEKDPETGKWKIGPSHHLLGYTFVSTQPNSLNRTSTPTKNFDCFYDEEITFCSTKDMLENLTKFSQNMEVMKNGGYISLGSVSDWTSVEKGIHKSNDPDDNNGSRFDYYDNTWFPMANFDFGEGRTYKDYASNGCVYAEGTIRYTKQDRMIDIMNKNVFTFNQQPIIPLSMYATRPLYLRNIPIIGAIANFFSIGDIHLFSSTKNRQTSSLIYFGDADLCAMCANQQKGFIADDWRPWKKDEQKVCFPVGFFGNNEVSYNRLGVNSVNTTFCIELTDNISLQPTGAEASDYYNTLYLGQSTYEDETPIFPDEPDRTLLVNGSLKAEAPDEGGYIIDAVIVQTIFDGKIRLSAYSTEDDQLLIPEWTTTILSNANWQGGAMRDWTNMYLLSNWTDRFCRQQDQFTYPLPPRKKETDGDYVWDINYVSNFSTPFTKAYDLEEDGNWSKLITAPEDENDYYCWRPRYNLREYYINYTDLGISAVVDKPSFVEYFENIQVNCQGSQTKYEEEGQSPFVSQWNEQYKTVGSFVRGVDTLNLRFCPASINGKHEFGFTDLQLPSSSMGTFRMLTIEHDISEGTLGIIPNIVLTIELLDDKIKLQVIDGTHAYGYDYIIRGGDDPDQKYAYLGTMGSTRVRYIYDLFFNQIKFVRRGTTRPISNKVYGVKSTETHLKSTKKKD